MKRTSSDPRPDTGTEAKHDGGAEVSEVAVKKKKTLTEGG